MGPVFVLRSSSALTQNGTMHGLTAFSKLPWTPGTHPLERKKTSPTGLVMLEFAPGFADPNWCSRSHVLFVVEGTLTLELRDNSVVVEAGNAYSLAPGTEHRAQNLGDRAVVAFVVSDLVPSTP